MSLQQVTDRRRTILYYPTILILDDLWLRQALLYWDGIASIVPRQWDQAFTPEMEYLQEVGQFKTYRPEDIMRHGLLGLMEEDFFNIVESAEYQAYLGPRQSWILDKRVHEDKVSHSITGFLVDKGLVDPAMTRELGLDWYLFERKTSFLYMSILAKYLADDAHHLTTTSTSMMHFRDLAYLAQPSSRDRGSICAEVIFKDILPSPREDVPLEAIIDFKDRYRSELLRFRAIIDKFERDLSAAQRDKDIRELTVQFVESAELGLAELSEVLHESDISTIVSSLKALIDIKSPTLWAAAGVYAGQATDIAKIPIDWAMGGLAIMGGIEILSRVACSNSERHAHRRESAFSYLYYARELI